VKRREALHTNQAVHNLGNTAKHRTVSGCLSAGRMLNLFGGGGGGGEKKLKKILLKTSYINSFRNEILNI
jgi:hypothetical protein